MNNEMIGNTYKYIIDTSYGINKDGFIAIGSESIVYKGLKTKLDGGLQFSCVLKFKPKSILTDGNIVDRLEIFKTEEWKIFEELRECRSIVRIDDVIDNLRDFSLPCNRIVSGVISNDSYFCVIEEFIDGWSLEEFCREEYWKLRRIEPLSSGLSNVINYHNFSNDEKSAVNNSYNYDNTLKYQDQILLFMLNLCEIMEFVTEQKNILHLDIKPENIMVTRYGKELVLIDFGRSKKVTKANRFAKSHLSDVNYNENENLDKMYQYGTLGYAAPECYAKAADDSQFPFAAGFEQGEMSIESDIFSFGGTFWECLNIFELVTKNKQFTDDIHDFYRNNFLNDAAYFNRDLSCTSVYYHKKLESIVKKCTRKRTNNYCDLENRDYYHSYKDLRKDIENARDSVPTIVKEENPKVKNAFSLCGSMLSLFSVFLIIYFIYHLMAFNIALGKWDAITSNYNDTQFYRLEEVAENLITTASASRVDDIYGKIVSFTYKSGDISEYEATMIVSLLQQINNKNLLPERVDEIMRNANTKKFKEISTEIVKLDVIGDSVGYDLARAIFNVEVGKTKIVDAYETLGKYKDNIEFRNAVIKLKNTLDNDENINIIARDTELSRAEIQEFFKV
ncbi:serine/threonine-protein kinase PknD [Ruminiclostridium hungatei]|uniref:Serine/threonine-protein kinase PknD n=1 Tax=Ruminiclostridium hungatei TaxID=48256 RepID=A0A1V4SDQ0_RUMHU|nr:protein kinase [Ruminiclostridium hungatei]OPX42042.1 serine/threonine-protein kinase PknD [Ruminiclostridium hungatei]